MPFFFIIFSCLCIIALEFLIYPYDVTLEYMIFLISGILILSNEMIICEKLMIVERLFAYLPVVCLGEREIESGGDPTVNLEVMNQRIRLLLLFSKCSF